MNRQVRSFTSLVLCVLTFVSGCHPTQPFFFSEDGELLGKGDLSHYMDVATDIEYPNVNEPTLDEVIHAKRPLTLSNADNYEMWDISLEEVIRITLSNSQVIRHLGGRITDLASNIANSSPVTLSQNLNAALTTYDPAIVESGPGAGTGSPLSGTGVEAALSEFDATLDTSINWAYNDRPQNFGGGIVGDIFANNFRQDLGNFTAGITKTTADGSTFEIRNNTNYDQNNNGSRAQPSDWVTNFEASFTRPLLQGAGTQYNRIAGPLTFQQSSAGIVNQVDGVIISRIRTDITLADFESGVRDLLRDVEDAYWELYFAYRDLEARKIGRDSALETWRKINAIKIVGGQGGEADKEAQARSQYFTFRAEVETALTNLFRVENRLRYMMGIATSDGRLIRPTDEPTIAKVHFDWQTVHSEALARRAEVRRQKWQVKRRELELIASRNHLLPRLDAVGRYRWLGAGDDLINSNRNGIPPFMDGSTAFEVLTGGNYQEWEMGIQLTLPIGFRRALSGVRHHELLLARERAVLQDLELEISHQLGDAVRDLDFNYQTTQTRFNGRVAAQDEVDAVEAVYDVGNVTLDLLLDAQRRRAVAESAYYRSLIDYNRAIMRVHYRKGSLLEHNGVYLAEGPWPGKAYFDALRRARQRDASTYLDYGFTRPSVISRGPHSQRTGQTGAQLEIPTPTAEESSAKDAQPIEDNGPEREVIPTPERDEAAAIEANQFNGELAALPTVEAELSDSMEDLQPNVVEGVVQSASHTEKSSASATFPAENAAVALPNPYRQNPSPGVNAPGEAMPAEIPATNPLRQPSGLLPFGLFDENTTTGAPEESQPR